jgi:hypothetical protein
MSVACTHADFWGKCCDFGTRQVGGLLSLLLLLLLPFLRQMLLHHPLFFQIPPPALSERCKGEAWWWWVRWFCLQFWSRIFGGFLVKRAGREVSRSGCREPGMAAAERGYRKTKVLRSFGFWVLEVWSGGSDDGVVVDDMETEAGEAGESRGDPTGQASASYGSCVHRFATICPPFKLESSWSTMPSLHRSYKD